MTTIHIKELKRFNILANTDFIKFNKNKTIDNMKSVISNDIKILITL